MYESPRSIRIVFSHDFNSGVVMITFISMEMVIFNLVCNYRLQPVCQNKQRNETKHAWGTGTPV